MWAAGGVVERQAKVVYNHLHRHRRRLEAAAVEAVANRQLGRWVVVVAGRQQRRKQVQKVHHHHHRRRHRRRSRRRRK
jgi:hypothetical protein